MLIWDLVLWIWNFIFMLLSDFNYHLPTELIAQEPTSPRDACRLLVLGRKSGEISHRHFFEIGKFLRPGDLLVVNNTKVFKARLIGDLAGKKVEIFLVRPVSLPLVKGEREGVRSNVDNPSSPPLRKGRKVGCWLALGKPGRRLKPGETVNFADDFSCRIISKNKSGELEIDFGLPPSRVIELANKYGHIPVPPYIKSEPTVAEDYQTIYADEHKIGSVAAPTAGFHFTEELIKKLKEPARNASSHSEAGGRGIEFAEITLHVGLGTFLPIREDDISAHKMHSEWVEISAAAAEKINAAKHAGRRVIAVGTTTTRALEGVANSNADFRLQNAEYRQSVVKSFSGFVNLFIQPGFEFKVIDGLVTNFHLPKSTLLVLVSAFAGRENIIRAYEEAVREKYRFYSFGDAVLII